jgi:hypothetical protein
MNAGSSGALRSESIQRSNLTYKLGGSTTRIPPTAVGGFLWSNLQALRLHTQRTPPAAEWIRMPLPRILADGTTARLEHPYKGSVPTSSAIYEKDLTTTKLDGRI